MTALAQTATWTEMQVANGGGHVAQDAFMSDVFANKAWNIVRGHIATFAGYHENWDGYLSKKPREEIINAAYGFLANARANGVPAPSVAVLSPDGSITIEWRSGESYLQAEISDSPEIEWMQFGAGLRPFRWKERSDKRASARDHTWGEIQTIEEGAADSA